MKTCMTHAGLEYGALQIFGIIVAEVLCLQQNPFADEHKYVCSEWVAEQLEILGHRFDKDLDLVKPIDIYDVLEYEN
jgi:hypothetical protein